MEQLMFLLPFCPACPHRPTDCFLAFSRTPISRDPKIFPVLPRAPQRLGDNAAAGLLQPFPGFLQLSGKEKRPEQLYPDGAAPVSPGEVSALHSMQCFSTMGQDLTHIPTDLFQLQNHLPFPKSLLPRGAS